MGFLCCVVISWGIFLFPASWCCAAPESFVEFRREPPLCLTCRRGERVGCGGSNDEAVLLKAFVAKEFCLSGDSSSRESCIYRRGAEWISIVRAESPRSGRHNIPCCRIGGGLLGDSEFPSLSPQGSDAGLRPSRPSRPLRASASCLGITVPTPSHDAPMGPWPLSVS